MGISLGNRRYRVHRVAVFALAAALAAAPAPGVPSQLSPPASYDLGAQLMLHLFGENSDASASLAAAYGDRASESPLRDLALHDPATASRFPAADAAGDFVAQVAGGQSSAVSPFDVPAALRDRALRVGAIAVPAFSPQAPQTPSDGVSAAPVADFTVGQYQPVAPVPSLDPGPGNFVFGSAPRAAAAAPPSLAFGDANAPAGASGSSSTLPSTVRLGKLQIHTRVVGASVDAPSQSLQDSGYGAGANFDVRAGGRDVNVDVSSNYERLTRNDSAAGAAPALGSSQWQLPADGTPLVIPNYADLSKVSLGAAVAVPVVHGLTLNLNYGADRMFGGYGLPGLVNLDATGNTYGGRLTFDIPHSSSTLSISASQLRYQDNIAPASNFTQTREDVNFTVKF